MGVWRFRAGRVRLESLMDLLHVLVPLIGGLAVVVVAVVVVRRALNIVLAVIDTASRRVRAALSLLAAAFKSAGASLLFRTRSDLPSRSERIAAAPRAPRNVLATAGASLLVRRAEPEYLPVVEAPVVWGSR